MHSGYENDLYSGLFLFRNREVYEKDENSHEKFKSTKINSISNSEFLGQKMNRILALDIA